MFRVEGRGAARDDAVGATGVQRAGKGDRLDLALLKAKDLEGLEIIAQAVAPDGGKGGDSREGFEALPEGFHPWFRRLGR